MGEPLVTPYTVKEALLERAEAESDTTRVILLVEPSAALCACTEIDQGGAAGAVVREQQIGAAIYI